MATQDERGPHEPLSRGLASSWHPPLVVFVLSVAMTLGVYAYLAEKAALARHGEVSRDAALITSEVRDRLRMHAQFLRGLRAFFAASDNVTLSEWEHFVDQLQLERNIPGIQAYGYAPALTAALLPAYVTARHKMDKGRDAAPFSIRPAEYKDPLILPVSYIAPTSAANLTALGFNIASEARRAEAVALARDRDDIALTRRIELVQEEALGDRQPGLLMVLPIYRPGMETANVEQRRRAFVGVVFVAYRIGDFMQSFNYANSGLLALRIFDDESFNAERDEHALTLLFDGTAAGDTHSVEVRELEFGQRNWQMRFSPRTSALQDTGPLWMLFSGLLVSGLLAVTSRIQSISRVRAEDLAKAMTAELRRSEERFKLAADGTSDGIWDRDLEHGTVWHSDRLRHLLGFPADTDTANVDFYVSRIHPDDRPALDAALRRHLQDRLPYSVEYRFRKGNGEWAWFRSHGQGVWHADGHAIRLVGSISDISTQKASEEKIAHYRDFLQTVLKFIPHPVFVKNRRREYVAVNTAFCRLLGRDESEILGRVDLGKTRMEESVARHVREMDELVLSGAGEQVDEHTLTLRTGTRIVIARKALATDPDGEPILIGTLTEVTELRRAESERLAADRQRQAILDAATEVSIIATDIRGTVKLFNRGAEKMLGYRAEEVVDRHAPALFHLTAEIEARARFLSAELGYPVAGFEVFVAVPKLHGAENREWTFVRKDGGRLVVSLVVTAVRDENGSISGYLGIATDVSERKRATTALERQTAQMKTIIEHIPGGVSLIDSELHFIVANRALQKVLDLPDSLFASGWPSLYEVALFNARRGEYGPGDPETQAMGVVENARNNPAAHCFERTRPNGRTIEVRGAPLPDGGFVTIYTDVTERKAAEAELRRHRDHLLELVEERTLELRIAKEAAERASAAKSEFLANMSHELRTPMHSVLSFASLGGEKARSLQEDKLAHHFVRIHQSGERLLALLNNLLDLSKLEAGMMRLNVESADLPTLVKEAIAESDAWAQRRGIALVFDNAAGSLSATVDTVRIGQVIRNLLSNAIKFSPDNSEIRIEIRETYLAHGRRAGDPEDIPAASICVRDAGIGIPEDELVSIFDKFVQSSKTRTGAGGTGLGLSICREIVLAHQGVIRACNNPSGGASLIVTLPLQARWTS